MSTICDNNIPKVIHYCWFGGNPLPELAEKCIASWRKYLPDYEIKLWDETNFDVNCCVYTRQAYEAKKYAFVSDYVRFRVLYENGGIYFDTDVEVINSLSDIIAAGPFMGFEKSSATVNDNSKTGGVAPGLGLGVNPGLGLYREILEKYEKIHFLDAQGRPNYTTVVKYTTDVLLKYGLKLNNTLQKVCGINIYPSDYFCPSSFSDRTVVITQNTRTIHHFAESWVPQKGLIQSFIIKLCGKTLTNQIVRIKKKLKKRR